MEPSQAARDFALLRRALSRERGDVPERVIRDVAREADQRARRRRPMREGGPVGADDALRELRHDRVGETFWTSLPDVRAAVRGRGDAARKGQVNVDGRRGRESWGGGGGGGGGGCSF